MFCIYKITHKPSGLVYIGMTSQGAEKRLKQHLWESNQHDTHTRKLMTILRECSESDIDHCVIEQDILTRTEAFKRERYYIDKYDSEKSGLNSTGWVGAYDPTVYVFTNLDGRTFRGTKAELCLNNNVCYSNMSRVMGGKQASCSGWMRPHIKVVDGIDVVDEDQLQNITTWTRTRVAGVKNDHTIYVWCHRDGFEFTGTRIEFGDHTGMSTERISDVVAKDRIKTLYGWGKPTHVVVDGITQPRFDDKTIARLKANLLGMVHYDHHTGVVTISHKDGRSVTGTRSECRKNIGIAHSEMSRIIKHGKTVKGWSLQQTNEHCT